MIWPGSAGIFAAALIAVFALLVANGVDTKVSDGDRAVIAQLNVDESCGDVDGFHAELECVETVQTTVFENFPSTKDAFEKGVTRHRAQDYAARGYGSCYDRAMLIEQTLRHYGFNIWRVAIYERQQRLWDYLRPGIRSHALSVVETSRGEMVVESVEPFLGVDKGGSVYGIREVRDGLNEEKIDGDTFGADIPDNFFGGDFIYFHGVYSRHGYFFEPHLPAPEIDWGHFRLW